MSCVRVALLFVLLQWPALRAEPVATACGHHDYAPWNWQQGGRIVGTCADIVQRAFASAGVTVRFDYVGPWPRCQALVAAGRVDINICAFRNAEREAYSQFIPLAMGNNEVAAFVRRDAGWALQSWDDLKGRRVGLVNGVSMGGELDQFLQQHTTIDRTNDFSASLRKLALGRVDVVPFGREAGKLAVAHLGLGEQLRDLPTPLLHGQLYISVSKQSHWLLPYLPAVQHYLAAPSYPRQLQDSLSWQHRYYLQANPPPSAPRP
ncbi:transporter substrate-binding domain-containing protein [Vogesella sp. DC21W]|uniref:Transporter substrate-binding domain-containing protein n=1 Tax=Vogesella aquatica TaxID=2984206 RepID=A0ABT5IZK4_9NEIS|nr:transporter substrate-binding domain-containing protein [Vogesella aquatica]MDC7718015.1 transporter substrate-binding domain-containing protein [Vogesella aquatica]